MNRHYAPAGADLWNAPRTLTLTIPLWDEATEHQPRTLRTPARAMEVPVILWPELEVAGAVVHAQGYAAVETFIVLREWNAQVLLHELLHVALGGVIPAAQDGTGGHDVIGAVEVALAPFVTFPTPVSSGEAGTGEADRDAGLDYLDTLRRMNPNNPRLLHIADEVEADIRASESGDVR